MYSREKLGIFHEFENSGFQIRLVQILNNSPRGPFFFSKQQTSFSSKRVHGLKKQRKFFPSPRPPKKYLKEKLWGFFFLLSFLFVHFLFPLALFLFWEGEFWGGESSPKNGNFSLECYASQSRTINQQADKTTSLLETTHFFVKRSHAGFFFFFLTKGLDLDLGESKGEMEKKRKKEIFSAGSLAPLPPVPTTPPPTPPSPPQTNPPCSEL